MNYFLENFGLEKKSKDLGLIDGLGNADQILKDKFGEEIEIKKFGKPKGWIAKKLSSSENQAEKLISIMKKDQFGKGMVSKKKKKNIITFQDTLMNLQKYWAKQGCVILQPYDIRGWSWYFSSSNHLRSLGEKPWKTAYVQPSRRPTDGRYGENPNRLQHYYQFQVLIKPSPDNIKKLYLNSISSIGIDYQEHDIRFIEDDWESPTLGAAGLGWEVWCDGMEITQFTYFQQMAGLECKPVSVEITYGLERLCMFIQNKKMFLT